MACIRAEAYRLRERVRNSKFTDFIIVPYVADSRLQVLFFEDQDVVTGLQKAIPAYSAMFAPWSEHTHGIHASNLWIALEQEGLGANLQHYSNLIEKDVAETWGIPVGWQLKAQLVFGTPVGQLGEKTFKPLGERVKIFGGNLTLN